MRKSTTFVFPSLQTPFTVVRLRFLLLNSHQLSSFSKRFRRALVQPFCALAPPASNCSSHSFHQSHSQSDSVIRKVMSETNLAVFSPPTDLPTLNVNGRISLQMFVYFIFIILYNWACLPAVVAASPPRLIRNPIRD